VRIRREMKGQRQRERERGRERGSWPITTASPFPLPVGPYGQSSHTVPLFVRCLGLGR
jgi:hypothetical protein